MGYKLEQFIFDAFPYAPSTALFEVYLYSWECLPSLNMSREWADACKMFFFFLIGEARWGICTSEKWEWVECWYSRQCSPSCPSSARSLGSCGWWLLDSLSSPICNRYFCAYVIELYNCVYFKYWFRCWFRTRCGSLTTVFVCRRKPRGCLPRKNLSCSLWDFILVSFICERFWIEFRAMLCFCSLRL